MTYLHPFVIYASFGTLVGTVLAAAVVKCLPKLPPAIKRGIWWVSLALPFAGYVLSWTWRWQTGCWGWMLSGQGYAGAFFTWLCRVGTALGYALAPFFAVALVAGVTKAVAAAGLARRFTHRFPPERADNRVARLVQELAPRMGLAPPAVILAPHPPGQAFAIGFRRPILVLSRQLVRELDDSELTAVLAHELSHVEVGDHWKKWLGVMLRDILFFTGLSFLVFRNLQAETEAMADARAVQVTGTPLALAAALIKGWRVGRLGTRWQMALDNFAPLVGLGEVQYRVQRLIEEVPALSHTGMVWGRWLPAAVAAVTAVVLFLFC